MAKAKKSCTVSLRRFKTRRGKVVTFRGRSGGDSARGGKCAHKARRKTHQMKLIGAAGRACARVAKPGSKKNIACLKAKFR